MLEVSSGERQVVQVCFHSCGGSSTRPKTNIEYRGEGGGRLRTNVTTPIHPSNWCKISSINRTLNLLHVCGPQRVEATARERAAAPGMTLRSKSAHSVSVRNRAERYTTVRNDLEWHVNSRDDRPRGRAAAPSQSGRDFEPVTSRTRLLKAWL